MIIFFVLHSFFLIILNIEHSFFDNKVTFIVPDNWKETQSVVEKELIKKHYQIKIVKTSKGNINAFSFINIYKMKKPTTIAEVDNIVSDMNKSFGHYIVHGIQDGKNWKTYLSAGKNDDINYISLCRYGFIDDILVQFWLGFPYKTNEKDSLENDDRVLMVDTLATWSEQYSGIVVPSKIIKDYIEDFNGVCENLKINAGNVFSTRFIVAQIPNKKEAKYYRQIK